MRKTVWMYWHSGRENAPPIVKTCIESWERQNPNWSVCVLDDSTISLWVDLDEIRAKNPRLNIQIFSDILRWQLIHDHGGVWADATLFCTIPLDEWLPQSLSPEGFFCFRATGAIPYHSWFIAGTPRQSIVLAMNNEIRRYFIDYGNYLYYWDIRFFWRAFHLLETICGKHNQEIWRSSFFRKFIKASPYFLIMYLMGAAINRSAPALSDFNKITLKYKNDPHALQDASASATVTSIHDVRKLLNSDCPVQKLTLKRFVDDWSRLGLIEILDQHSRFK